MKSLYFTIPGWGGSSEDHWQTFFESRLDQCVRIEQENFNEPDLDKWVEKLNEVLSNYPSENCILIGHSLGCFVIAEWLKRYKKSIRGAFFVAPADLKNAPEIIPQTGFDDFEVVSIKSPSMLIASTNDAWLPQETAEFLASIWGSELRWVENGGHISSASGFGKWEEGLLFLNELSHEIG